jgi:hypothetical protein
VQASVATWGGEEALRAVGARGIPATFVLDAEGRELARFGGWGPSLHTELEAALAAALGR